MKYKISWNGGSWSLASEAIVGTGWDHVCRNRFKWWLRYRARFHCWKFDRTVKRLEQTEYLEYRK